MEQSKLKEIVAYCAANIVDWDLKSELAVRMIGRHMPIDPGFRNEIEDKVSEWADDNDYSIDFLDGIDAEEIVLWAE